MEEDKLLRQVIRRLDILIALQLETQGSSEAARPSKKIQRLNELGLPASEIATILDKKTNYVTATLSQQKKSGKKESSR